MAETSTSLVNGLAIWPSMPARWHWAMALNPLAPLVEMMRSLFLGRGEVNAGQYFCSSAIAIFVFLAGVMIFQRTERTFIDTV